VIILDAGDNLSGNSNANFTAGKTTIDLYNQINQSIAPIYATLGNHE
jgi:2',3'-cyclic-nucleotide 2'-phosphodiesterase (5'-nucleotidase family)